MMEKTSNDKLAELFLAQERLKVKMKAQTATIEDEMEFDNIQKEIDRLINYRE